MNERVLIYDPVPFKGGSKQMMKTIVAELPRHIEVWVISNDRGSWCDANVHFVPLFSPRCLQHKTTGIFYFLKHLVYLGSLIKNMIKLKRFNKIIGLSGPCVDFALYLLSAIINIDIIQLVQGDIAHSKVAGFGLSRAKSVFYLPSTHASILQALTCYCGDASHRCSVHTTNKKFIPFVNGIDLSAIKTKATGNINKDKDDNSEHNSESNAEESAEKNSENIGFLWAASLLKWKRVEFFIAAMTQLNTSFTTVNNFSASVCYIEPQTDGYLEVANIEQVDNIHWYADPKNLNDIRANSSVFISTSENEPFGLSILESMAAGLAIVIPADNAYWDQHLTDGVDCVKYDPNNVASLVQVLTRLVNEPVFLSHIAQQAKRSAQQYTPDRCYAQILKCIPN